jgi:hypothetical protein
MVEAIKDSCFDADVEACMRACDTAGAKDNTDKLLLHSEAVRFIWGTDKKKIVTGNTDNTQPTRKRRVSFDLDGIAVHEVTPYSEVYGRHPSEVFFDKFDQAPACSFIADPNATEDVEEQVSDGETEIDEDETPQPLITRKGFVRPVLNGLLSVSNFDEYDEQNHLRPATIKKDEEEDDDAGTQEPNSRESSTHDFSSDSSNCEDGLLDSPTTWCVGMFSKLQDVSTLDQSLSHQGQDEDTLMDQSTSPVTVESHGMVEPKTVMHVRENSAAPPHDSEHIQQVDCLSQRRLQSLGNLAVMLCSLPAIVAKKCRASCAERR